MSAPIRRGFIDTKWGQIHYRRAGDGPACLLFHESPLSSRLFERVLPRLAVSRTAIALDTPGYGDSDPPEAPLEIPQYAERLLAAIDAIGADRFAVAGIHTGSAIALEIAAQAGADRVTHAIFSGLPWFTDEERVRFTGYIAVPQLHEDGTHVSSVWASRRRSYGDSAGVDLLQMAAAEMLRVYERYHWAFGPIFRYDPEPRLRGLSCPILFLNGEHDNLARADRAAAAIVPGARVHIVAGAGGPLAWREPARYADAVLDFLKK